MQNFRLVLCLWLCTFLSLKSLAVLDGDESTVEDMRATVSGSVNQTAKQGYKIYDISHSGTAKIKEFVGSDGKIFAVSWCGVSHPDLSVLLGNHFSKYKDKNDKITVSPGRAPSHVETEKIVVETFGHMGRVCGHAYLYNSFPLGFKVGDIK